MAGQYEFGQFRLDLRERRLTRGGDGVHLEPKSFDLLIFLVERAGRLVQKQELADAVWPQTIVSDNSLTRAIHHVRTALDDDADAPTFIETVPGSGYRFIAAVAAIDPTTPDTSSRPAAWYRRALPLVLAVFLAVAAWFAMQSPDGDHPAIERLAVLPLSNLTGDERQQYFVQGIHEALIAELSRIERIDVISRTSVARYRDTELSIPEIAAQLEVDALIEGSVARADDQLTVTVQLIGASPERHLWAKRFHRSVGDIFEITTEVARSIAAEISIELSPSEQTLLATTRPVNAEAFDTYLQAQFHGIKRNREGYRRAEELFERALELDPRFAPAYTKLAEIYGSAAIFGMRRPADSWPQATTLAQQALRLDSSYFHGHHALAAISFYRDRDWIAAERGARRAIALNPNAATTYRFLAEILSVTGRHDEAMNAIERGRRLDPFNPISQFKPSLILYLKRDYEEAIRRTRQALPYYEEFWQGYWLLCLPLSATGHHADAIAACESSVSHSGRAPLALGALGYVNAVAGKRDEAAAILAELEEMREQGYVGATSLAIIHGALGELDLAFAELERAYEDRDVLLVHENYGFFDPLRADPRFALLWESHGKQ